MSALISAASGHDASGHRLLVDNYTMLHTHKKHGNPTGEARRGQKAITVSDWISLHSAMASDDITVTNAGATHQGIPVLQLGFRDSAGDRLTLVVEHRHKRNFLAPITLYKK